MFILVVNVNSYCAIYGMSYEFYFHADMYSERHRNDTFSNWYCSRIALSVMVEQKRK